MPLPNGLPEWVYPGTPVQRTSDDSLWTIVQVSLLTGVNVMTVTLEAVNAIPGGSLTGQMDETSPQVLLEEYVPLNSQRASHIIPVEGALGSYQHPTRQRLLRFTLSLVGDEYVTLEYDPDDLEGNEEQIENVQVEVYRANVLWQEMPAYLPGQQWNDAGVPWNVTRVTLDDDPTVYMQSPREPFNRVEVALAALVEGGDHHDPVESPQGRHALMDGPRGPALVYILATAERMLALDVQIVGSNRVERVPVANVHLRMLPHHSGVEIHGHRRFNVGDIFISTDAAPAGFDNITFGILQVETGETSQILTITHDTNLAGMPERHTRAALNSATLLGNRREEGLGYPPPPPPEDGPLTRFPLTGFKINKEALLDSRPVNRRSSFERLLDDEDSD